MGDERTTLRLRFIRETEHAKLFCNEDKLYPSWQGWIPKSQIYSFMLLPEGDYDYYELCEVSLSDWIIKKKDIPCL